MDTTHSIHILVQVLTNKPKGSHGSPHHAHNTKLPEYFVQAENCGYELNILDRVSKHKISTPRKNRRKEGTGGYATASGYSSSDGLYANPKTVAEQGVDEILQMKILESLVDTEMPSTVVLASGDAAEAEFSAGFKKTVERALKLGWKVEIVAWSEGLSRDYRPLSRKWKNQFTTIELDDFCEDLLGLYPRRFVSAYDN